MKMNKTIYGLSRSRDEHGNIVKRNLNDVVNCIHTNAGSGYKTMEILIVEVEDEQEDICEHPSYTPTNGVGM